MFDILGDWRVTKIHFHGDKIQNFENGDNIIQLSFETDGKMSWYELSNKQLHKSPLQFVWKNEGGKITFTEDNKWEYQVVELTNDTLTIQSIDAAITWYYVRINTPTPISSEPSAA